MEKKTRTPNLSVVGLSITNQSFLTSLEVAAGGPQDEPISAEVEYLGALQELYSFCASCGTGKRRVNEKLV